MENQEVQTPEVLTPELSRVESMSLRECEETIRSNITAFVAVGRALRRIRDERLYREHYPTFEEYLKDRWDISRARGYELITGAVVVANLSAIADKRLPMNEAQVRPLKVLKPDQQRQVWQQVVTTAPNGKVSARWVAQKVRQFLEEISASQEGGEPIHIEQEDPDENQELENVLKALKRYVKSLDSEERRQLILNDLQRLLETMKAWVE